MRGDWVGCARALAEHGMPAVRPDPQDADAVLVGERRYAFSAAVADWLLDAR